jgi:toxin ParE1/3/4
MIKVRFAEPAEYDLINIEHYIYVELCNPEAADRIVMGILLQAESLTRFPERHPFVSDDLLERLGIRLTWFESYNIFYIYDELKGVVNIIRILYDKQDWKSILRT